MPKDFSQLCTPHVQSFRLAERDAGKTGQAEMWKRKKEQAQQGEQV